MASRLTTLVHLFIMTVMAFSSYHVLHRDHNSGKQSVAFVVTSGENIETCPPGGQIMTPENSTVYISHPDLRIGNLVEFKKHLRKFVDRLPRKCRTVILDCPSVLPELEIGPTADELEPFPLVLLELIATYNYEHAGKDGLPILKVWLRLGDSVEFPSSVSADKYCSKFALLGNELFPGTVQGHLTHLDSPLVAFAAHKGDSWKRNLKELKAHGLQMGLMVQDYECLISSRLPAKVLKEFSSIYYYDYKDSSRVPKWTLFGKLLWMETSDLYKKCRYLLKHYVPEAPIMQHALDDDHLNVYAGTNEKICIVYNRD